MKQLPTNLLVFLPTLNEFGNISLILKEIHFHLAQAQILVIDDGSTDGTREEIAALNLNNVSLINRKSRKGIGGAHLQAMNYAISNCFDYLVTLDADGTHKVSDVLRLLEIAPLYDLVIGSRFHSKDSLRGWSLARKFLTRAAHFTTKFGLGLSHDCSSGLRCYNLIHKKFNPVISLEANGYDFFFKSIYVLSKSGFTIKDLPVILEARRQGESKMDFLSAIISIRKLLLTVLSFRLSQVWSRFRV